MSRDNRHFRTGFPASSTKMTSRGMSDPNLAADPEMVAFVVGADRDLEFGRRNQELDAGLTELVIDGDDEHTLRALRQAGRERLEWLLWQLRQPNASVDSSAEPPELEVAS